MDVFLARQPIFDQGRKVIAYELLYRRDRSSNEATIANPDRATSEVLLNAFSHIGLDRVTGGQRAFINFTRAFLTGELPMPFAPEQVTVEVLETIRPDAEVVAGLQRLSAAGFQIALDDFVFHSECRPLVQLADVVKLDIRELQGDALIEHVRRLRAHGCRLLAEKVETREEFEHCRRLGFDLYQGFFFCRPAVLEGRQVNPSRMATLQLLQRIHDPDLGFEELAELIGRDVTLVYKLLRYINSAYFGLSRRVESINDALLLLGLDNIRRWLSLVALSQLDEVEGELLVTTLTRARMCELLAEHTGNRRLARPAFLTGLFSSVDAFIPLPLTEILSSICLSGDIQSAVLERSGPFGLLLDLVIKTERGAWLEADRLGLSAAELTAIYLEACTWAEDSFSELA